MDTRYSSSTGGFYPDVIPYAELPGDLVAVSADDHAALLAGQQEGKVIVAGSGGAPTLANAPPLPLKAYAAAKRFAVETGGLVVSGMAVSTDEVSQGKISAAFALAKDDPTQVFQWKTQDGSFIQIDAPTALALGRAVGKHVQACFAAEAAVCAQIDAGSIATAADVDAYDAWPASHA